MIRIRTDDALHIVNKHFIERQYPESILNSEKNSELIISSEYDEKLNVKTMYMDIDPFVMKQIIKLIRGGNVDQNFTEHGFLIKTLERMNMKNLYENNSQIKSDEFDVKTEIEENEIITEKFEENEIQDNLAKIFGISKPHNITNTSEFDQFSSNVIESINESIGTISNNTENINKNKKKARSKIILFDTETN